MKVFAPQMIKIVREADTIIQHSTFKIQHLFSAAKHNPVVIANQPAGWFAISGVCCRPFDGFLYQSVRCLPAAVLSCSAKKVPKEAA